MNNGILQMIQGQIGYRFKNTDLLQQAFVRRSYSKENGGENNEVLEFIGDKALDFIIVKKLAEKYGSFANEYEDYDSREDCNEFISEYSEGKLTEIKKKLVCREMLASRIRVFGFQYELIMGKSDSEQNVHERDSVQEDLFEAIIGAVALDSNWNIDALTTVVDLMLDPDFYLDNGFDEEKNYVVLLQQWYQKKHQNTPKYVFSKTDSSILGRDIYPDYLSPSSSRFPFATTRNNFATTINNISYFCDVDLCLLEIDSFRMQGRTKAEARMAVAKKAYEYLEENGLLYDWIDEIGEPEIDRAINQLQELYQKGYIGEPRYIFAEKYDSDGNPVWRCECHVDDQENYRWGEYSSKKQGKKAVAYDMLCDLLDWEDDDET